MKRIIFTVSLMLLAIISVQAQEKGSYLTVAGSLGMNHFLYEMDNGRMGDPRLGYGGALGYQYFFNRHWGIGTGVGIAYYNTKANNYNNSFNNPKYGDRYEFIGRTDDDTFDHPTNYDLQLKLNGWTEKQYAYFLEVPLMVYYQTKWGEKQAVGMYAGLGAKAQFPVIYGKYEVGRGSELTVQGFYSEKQLTLPSGLPGDINDVSHHGFGTTSNPGYKDDLDVKISFAASLEAGFLVTLTRRVDLTVGGYLDVGLNNIKDGNKSESEKAYLIEPNTDAHQNKVGDGLDYNGIINSYVTNDVRLLGIGGKVGLRIKLGKLSEKKVEEEKDEMIVVQEVIKEPEPVVETKIEEPKGINDDDCYILRERIFFDLAKHDLRPQSIQTLDRKIAILRKYPDVKIVIDGNTCDLGGDRINIPLGQRRADAARDYMIRNGIDPSRITTNTKADKEQLLPNTNEGNRSQNRRDEFTPSAPCR